jgi:hypothetical protein
LATKSSDCWCHNSGPKPCSSPIPEAIA